MKPISVLAIDPGTHESGYAVFVKNGGVLSSGVLPNVEILDLIVKSDADLLAMEGFKARGNVIDNNCVQTIRWEGRFMQAWGCPDEVVLIPRVEVKKHLGLRGQDGDTAVNARLRELLGDKGTKSIPGPTYGVKSHAWAALGVAVTALHQQG